MRHKAFTPAHSSAAYRHGRTAFSLVELLVVIGVIAVLIGILMPALAAARQSARRVKAQGDMRQLLIAYTQYSIDNKGCLLLGYPPSTVNGVPVTAMLRDGTTIGAPTAQRYPWRLIRYVGDVWPILYYYGRVPDDDYIKGLSTGYGLNSVFLGGHDGGFFLGYDGDRPNINKHVMFRTREVRRPTEQIVFTESSYGASEFNGAFYVQPPRGHAPGGRWWIASADGKKALPRTGVFGGLPNGRLGRGTITGFFDGHVENKTPRELEDMRLWNCRTNDPNYDF